MATNLDLDDKLVERAKRLGGHKTKREAVNEALAQYIARLERLEILGLVGKVEWDPDYDYKKARGESR